MLNTPYELGWRACAAGLPNTAGPGTTSQKGWANGWRDCKNSGYQGTKGPDSKKPEAFAPGPRVAR